ncbi:YhcN/YlaJ family sporulation lipoprotein [Peribacillus frigoritolerans]|uniref:YhcN/YlaJ family sporulation lipoprotein n=1 Tax=Peribacillus frigoritolerans TaxID=450367 RepID=UPI001059D7A8|nr:YhcN/YlaJ family sporulation lipoprotein [Peribacillus frigoritolerans]TDL80016.1 YhcN/YlaJ family sporulation lipoprotein [Peribacillus frigoritolerans]
MRKFVFSALFILLALSGCQANQGSQDDTPEDYNGKPINVRNTVNEPVEKKSGEQISKRLVNLAGRVPGVNDVSAVVLGKYAVVGIDVNSKLDRNKVESIKYAVAESIQHDPYGANAVIIADADTTVRLREMGKDLQQGQPVGGILEELAAIVGRVMPEIPSDMLNNQRNRPTEEDNDQLNKKEQKELDREQEDQSENHLNQN